MHVDHIALDRQRKLALFSHRDEFRQRLAAYSGIKMIELSLQVGELCFVWRHVKSLLCKNLARAGLRKA